jgi:membrane-associated protease RseP (regulator of RpoE activity)
MYVALFVFAIAAVIMIHEFGHFATAKLFGMKAEKFFLGFGPTLWSFRRGETEYGVKALPLGGFVKISGMNRYEDVDPGDSGRLFYEQAAWKRVIVLVAGSATHFVVAFALLFSALAFVGAPTGEVTTTVEQVIAGSPADAAGLQPGDQLVSLDGEPVGEWVGAQETIRGLGGETAELVVLRDGAERTLSVDVAAQTPDGQERGYLGVQPAFAVQRYSLGGALRETVGGDFSFGFLTGATLSGLGEVFNPAALAEFFSSAASDEPRTAEDGGITSLVGAGQAVNAYGQAGNLFGVLVLLASLNIVLGTLNMLPLPPLDGGHVAVLAVEEAVNGVRRTRGVRERWHLDPAVVTPVALAVILFFGALSLTAIYLDITNPIGFQ